MNMASGGSLAQGTLSERELQVIELVAAGLTNQDIAEKLEISKRTVDNHISNILQKTETDNRVALVRWALQWGKVCIDDVNCCALPTVANPIDASTRDNDLEIDAEMSVESPVVKVFEENLEASFAATQETAIATERGFDANNGHQNGNGNGRSLDSKSTP
jgi:DNA-binding CsgD family transcriptional regulator